MRTYEYSLPGSCHPDWGGIWGDAAIWGGRVTYLPVVYLLTHVLEGSTVNAKVHTVGFQWTLTLFCARGMDGCSHLSGWFSNLSLNLNHSESFLLQGVRLQPTAKREMLGVHCQVVLMLFLGSRE